MFSMFENELSVQFTCFTPHYRASQLPGHAEEETFAEEVHGGISAVRDTINIQFFSKRGLDSGY